MFHGRSNSSKTIHIILMCSIEGILIFLHTYPIQIPYRFPINFT